MSRFRGDILILLAALIWGVAFYFQKTAMLHIGPLLFVGLRSAVAAGVLVPFAFAERPAPGSDRGSIVPVALLGGLVFCVAAIVQQVGIVTATVTNTGFLTALYVVLTPVIVWFVKRQRPAPHVWLAIVLALGGTWAMTGMSVNDFSRGDLLIAGAAVIWAVLFVVTGDAGRFGRPMVYTCLQFVTVACIALPLAFIFEPVSWAAIKASAPSILYVGILSSAVTFGLLAIGLRTVPPSHAAVILTLDTVFSAISGYVLLNERLGALAWLGAVLILMAIVIVQTGRRARPGG